MANLPSQHPTVALHLSDTNLTPLITSSSSPSHLDSLTALTAAALSSRTAAQRLRLGRPQRIMVEHPDAGPVVLHSYLDPCEAVSAGAPVVAPAGSGGARSQAGETAASPEVAGEEHEDGHGGRGDAPVAGQQSGEPQQERRRRRRQQQQSQQPRQPPQQQQPCQKPPQQPRQPQQQPQQQHPQPRQDHPRQDQKQKQKQDQKQDPSSDDQVPALVAVVVAGSAADAREARRAAARLENLGRAFQREWTAEVETDGGASAASDG